MDSKINKNSRSLVIYLSGKPGTGKYTIAKALANFSFVVCDNQLINNPIFELLNYDGFAVIPEFAWNAISAVRDAVLGFIAEEQQNNYVLTNNLYEDEGDRKLYHQVEQMATSRGSIFIPVRLTISVEEHLRRVTQPERRKRWKSIDPQEVYDQTPLLKINHPNLLELDVSKTLPDQVAEQILSHIQTLH